MILNSPKTHSRSCHDDVIKWKHFPRYWSLVDSPKKGQCCRAYMFSLTYVWTTGWANNRKAGYLRHHRAVMVWGVGIHVGHSPFGLKTSNRLFMMQILCTRTGSYFQTNKVLISKKTACPWSADHWFINTMTPTSYANIIQYTHMSKGWQ